jgi:hypothetical protein
MKKIIYWTCLTVLACGLLLAQGHQAFAEDQPINEDELFSGQDTMVKEETVVNNNVGDELKEKRISVTGEVNADATFTRYLASRDWSGLGTEDQGKLSNQIKADFFADIRLKGGIKSFLSVEASYFPQGLAEVNEVDLSDATRDTLGLDPDDVLLITTYKYTDLSIKEFFVDTNWQNKVYFRTGKQVLKWGPCYFWNPTDLINVEHKDFSDLNKIREGTYGVKVHIPSGVKQNTYFFVGMNGAAAVDDVFLSGKYEFLVGNTEMSLSAWGKKGYQPVYGYDVTGRLFNLDVQCEVSLSPGANHQILDYNTLIPTPEGDGLVPKVSLGCTKYFDDGDIKDRISLTGEVYYNGAGYDQNILQRIDDINPSLKPLYISQVYEPYRNSKYYLAFFSSMSKFIKNDLTLNVNGITNLVDHSGTLTCGVSYHPSLTDIFIDFSVSGNIGDKNTEATSQGNLGSVYLGTRILF